MAEVRAVNEAAFGDTAEATIVDALRDECPDVVSLVAVEEDTILGHIFFTPVLLSGGHGVTQGMGLAPMAVLPERQRLGIESLLVQTGIDARHERNCPFIIALGPRLTIPDLASSAIYTTAPHVSRRVFDIQESWL